MKKLITIFILMFCFSSATASFATTMNADFYIDRATKKLEGKDNQGAIIDANMALKLNPTAQKANAAILARAYAEINMGNNNSAAIRDFTKIIPIITQPMILRECYYSRGFAYGQLKDYKKAIADQDQAILIDSNYAEAYEERGLDKILRGLAKSQLDDEKYAIVDYKSAIEDFKRAKILYKEQSKQKRYEKMIMLIDAYSDLIPEDQRTQAITPQPTPAPVNNATYDYSQAIKDTNAQMDKILQDYQRNMNNMNNMNNMMNTIYY